MFILNQMLGVLLVNPDWDTVLQWNLKYISVGISLMVLNHFSDVFLATSTFVGYSNV